MMVKKNISLKEFLEKLQLDHIKNGNVSMSYPFSRCLFFCYSHDLLEYFPHARKIYFL